MSNYQAMQTDLAASKDTLIQSKQSFQNTLSILKQTDAYLEARLNPNGGDLSE